MNAFYAPLSGSFFHTLSSLHFLFHLALSLHPHKRRTTRPKMRSETESASEAPSYSDEPEESEGGSECSFAFLVEHGYEDKHKMVRDILENEEYFDLSDCEGISIDRRTVTDLAGYAEWLERKLREAQAQVLAAEKAKTKKATSTAPKAQAAPVKQKGSKLQMKAEVDKLAKEASSGISKQMSVSDDCLLRFIGSFLTIL